ncbi:MAG TPA: hypothetical protein EYF98_07180 [Planctomycetes bacterium]|nr:hypothetical protein [Planctomycetota bacterium]
MVLLLCMGSHYLFNCPGCGYSAEVSGGPDYGFSSQTETKVCTACRKVVDVLVGSREPTLIQPEDLNCCPECEGRDLLPWGESRPCPRCNGAMGDPTGPTTLWD